MSLLRTNVEPHKGLFTHDSTPSGYGPADLQSAYNLPSATAGSGETVAIVDAGDDPTAEADLATYRTQYGLSACTTANGCFEKVNQEGQQGNYPSTDGDWPVEESLDLDMVSATCPNCHILLVEADSAADSDLYTAEDEAVTLGTRYVSNSWASCEYSGETSDDQYFDHPGVVITAAGGDNGYDNYQQGCTVPNYPAASPYVTSVGGTTLTRDPGTARGWTETTWSPDPSATGSGCSQYEPKPAWQTDPGCPNRMTNDVSAVSDPNNGSGLAIYDTTGEGGWLEVGGTSAATPIIASTYALAGSPQAGTYPASYPYLNAAGLNDVTSGRNYDASCTPAYFCTAGPGYDGPTGLGTPDGVSAFEPVTAGTITGTVTDAATGRPIAGATVAAAAFTATTDGSGQYSLTVASGTYDMSVRAFGYAQQNASGVQVTQGQATTQSFALSASAGVTVSGTVTDGSGQGWPLFAKITIAGDPGKPVYTDPFTGGYSLSLPGQSTYAMTVTPLYPGYTADTTSVIVGTSNVQQNATPTVDPAKCDAPGYSTSSGTCGAISGGLVGGTVADANTGKPVNDVTVTDAAGQSATSKKTTDPALQKGFYWLFASPPGSVSLTASGSGYQSMTGSANVASGTVIRQDWTMKAGELVISPGSVSVTEALGQSATQKVTLTNNGSEPVQTSLGTQSGSFTSAGQVADQSRASSLPFRVIKGQFTPGLRGSSVAGGAARVGPRSSRLDWQDITPYPIPICCNAAAYDPQTGDVYSVGGFTSHGRTNTADGYVYDPSTNQWSAIAPAPQALQSPRAAFLDGTLYLAGGWLLQNHGTSFTPSAAVYAYTPGSNTWAKVASLPTAVAGPMAAVLGGQLYIVGGATYTCSPSCGNGMSDAVYRYDPASNTWATLANYPVPNSFGACAGVDDQIVCAGGRGALSATYLYDPASNIWTQGADMPSVRGNGYWGMSSAGAGGSLQIAGGVTSNSSEATNEAQAYDPVTNKWSLLPNTNYVGYDIAGACGFYQIGGGASGSSAQVLPGYDQCDGAGDTPWLSMKDTQVTVAAGRSVTVSVRLNAAKVSQPGTYKAALWAATNSPYPVQAIPVTLTVTPPTGWQKLSGMVTGTGRTPVADATITAAKPSGGKAVAVTQTNADGAYQLWLRAGRVQVSAAKDSYQPQATMITIKASAPAVANFRLKPNPGTSSHQAPAASAVSRAGTPARTASRVSTALAAAQREADAVARVCPRPKPGYAACLSLIRTKLARHEGILPADATPPGFGPADLQSAYDLPSATAGSGETVAVVDAGDDPSAETDLATYRKQYRLPACTAANGCFTKVNQEGQQSSYPPNLGWGVEESLDLDMVSAICPNCHIILVEGNNATIASLGRAENEAVKLGAKYVSNSYGTSGESPVEKQYDNYYDHPGVVITAASGDYGYNDEGSGADSPSFPAASPDVTAVGGTTLTPDDSSARGWTETAWQSQILNGQTVEGTGSGCSLYESKPAWQNDMGCKDRTDNDVAAVANPATGVAVYDSSDGGWVEVGGTSVASPIVASVYALAGTPVKGTYPASYPYLHAAGLNDVTSGTNGPCAPAPAYLCTAGPGYDGPTGLGTPDGVAAFKATRYGTLSGTVTSAATGQPVTGTAVTVDQLTATTTSTGSYTLTVPPGSYTATATRYGYAATSAAIRVTSGQTATQNFTVTKSALVRLTGKVTDGSGHGWPLYATITVSGVPGIPANTYYTSPYTGIYSLRVPGQNTYTLTVTPEYSGYAETSNTVALATASVQHNITVPVAPLACRQAPGYTFSNDNGTYEDFSGWIGTTPQKQWTNRGASGSAPWEFNPSGINNLLNSSGFAFASSILNGGSAEHATLLSPVIDLSHNNSPKLSFDTAYTNALLGPGSPIDISVGLSLDGGKTWQNVWQEKSTAYVAQQDTVVTVPVPQAADQGDVRVRFHFSGDGASLWEVGNVLVGLPDCAQIPGGIVAGIVSDSNTGAPVNGATVSSATKPGTSDITMATGDPALPGGYYWLFAKTGTHNFTAADGYYLPVKESVNVNSNVVTQQNWVLKAGQLTADASSLSAVETLGLSKTTKITFRDGGTRSIRVKFGTQAGSYTPLTEVPGNLSASSAKAASSWTSVADLPTPVVNNAVAYDPQTRQVFSVGGENGGGIPGQTVESCPTSGAPTASAYVYDSSDQTWKQIASLPQPLESPSAAFVDGTLYVVGGFNCAGDPSRAAYAYMPQSNSWSEIAGLPAGSAAPGIAVLDGQLYVIGGCSADAFCIAGVSQKVYRYNPGTGGWVKLADYPIYGGVAFAACAGTDGEVVCAGGLGPSAQPLSSTYLYNPSSNTWSQGADMPYADYQMAYSGANGQLQIAGGVSTSQVSQYNPARNTWSALPSLPSAEWGGGGACGMYVVGGDNSEPLDSAQVLSGYGRCDGTDDTGWLSTPRELTLQPGQSVTVKVSLDAAQVDQPGTYTANLYATTNTPYPNTVIPVTLTVKPPKSWGLLTGTVTTSKGKPLSGATMQIDTACTAVGRCGKLSYTLTTASNGTYQWWLPTTDNGLQVIAADDGYIQQVIHARIAAGQTLTLNYRLQNYQPPMR